MALGHPAHPRQPEAQRSLLGSPVVPCWRWYLHPLPLCTLTFSSDLHPPRCLGLGQCPQVFIDYISFGGDIHYLFSLSSYHCLSTVYELTGHPNGQYPWACVSITHMHKRLHTPSGALRGSLGPLHPFC